MRQGRSLKHRAFVAKAKTRNPRPERRESNGAAIAEAHNAPPDIEWTVAHIRAAERAANQGDLRRAADICETVMADERVGQCLRTLASVVSLPVDFQDTDGERADDEVADALRDDLFKFATEEELGLFVAWRSLLGVALARVDRYEFDEDTGRLLPILSTWHPRNLRRDFRRRVWTVETTAGRIDIEGDEWVLWTAGGLRPWAFAPWRGIARLWLSKYLASCDWDRYGERQGSGTQVITSEQNALGDAGKRQQLASDLADLGRDAVVVLPEGYDYKMVESVARTWEGFSRRISQNDTAIAITLCGQNLTSEVDGGSRAAAEVHERVESRMLNKVVEGLATALRPLFKLFNQLNFATSETPYAKWDTTPPPNHTERAEVFQKVSQGLSSLGVSADVDLDQLSATTGLTIRASGSRELND